MGNIQKIDFLERPFNNQITTLFWKIMILSEGYDIIAYPTISHGIGRFIPHPYPTPISQEAKLMADYWISFYSTERQFQLK